MTGAEGDPGAADPAVLTGLAAAGALAAGGAPVIALLGAESTGKTTLCEDLAARFAALPGFGPEAVGRVGESLRHFCDRTGRTPTRDEQAGIAEEQTRRIAQAARRHRVVIADTTAVMTAVYSAFVFGDRSLHPAALAAHRQAVAVTLVTALDLPWVADGHQRDGPHVREPVDRLLRAALREGGIDHAVVGGVGDRRAASAWRALGPLRRHLGWPDGPDDTDATLTPMNAPEEDVDPAGSARRRWRAWCECCADPSAEALGLRSRRPRPPPPG